MGRLAHTGARTATWPDMGETLAARTSTVSAHGALRRPSCRSWMLPFCCQFRRSQLVWAVRPTAAEAANRGRGDRGNRHMSFSTGLGSEIISAMALPVLDGLLITDEVVALFLPVRFYRIRHSRWLKIQARHMAKGGRHN